MIGLSIIDIHKYFGDTHALTGVSFEVLQSEIVAVLGPSGCGKSTLLSIIAGLEAPDRGDVLWNGKSLAGTPAYRRGFGLMFQDFALFPHKNVYENVAFGLQMIKMQSSEMNQRVSSVLELVGLPGFESRDVSTLSGGEEQRVALARSLAPRPHLLMLDEPLGSLDRTLRERLVIDLHGILRSSKQMALYVTHDQEEAFSIANRVVLMNKGGIEQIDTPQGIYHKPASIFVARFLGLNNLFQGEIGYDTGFYVSSPIGDIPISAEMLTTPQPTINQPPFKEQTSVTVLMRPDAVSMDSKDRYTIQGTIHESTFRGDMYRAVIMVNGLPLSFHFPSHVQLPENGKPVQLGFDPERAIQIFKEVL